MCQIPLSALQALLVTESTSLHSGEQGGLFVRRSCLSILFSSRFIFLIVLFHSVVPQRPMRVRSNGVLTPEVLRRRASGWSPSVGWFDTAWPCTSFSERMEWSLGPAD